MVMRYVGVVNYLFAHFHDLFFNEIFFRTSNADKMRYISCRFNWGIPVSTKSATYKNANGAVLRYCREIVVRGKEIDPK